MYISNETRVTIYTINNNLGTTIGKGNTVFAMGLVTITVLFVLESLGFSVVNIIDIVVEGSYIGIVISGGRGSGGDGEGGGSKGDEANKGLKIRLRL